MRDLTVRLPDDRVLIDALDLRLTPGEGLLIAGPSGSGKTTLLRSLADLWPYAEGAVRRPLGDGVLFLSQQQTLYALLREELPDAVVVGVGHGSTLDRFHGNRLDLRGDGSWATTEPVG